MKKQALSKDVAKLTNVRVSAKMVEERNTFLIKKLFSNIQPQSNTYWEEITCVGYNPGMNRLEAVVAIKQSSGYNGGLCSKASREFVRFFVDFKDGGGFRDIGMTCFKSADISDLPPGQQHPLKYMVSIPVDDEKYRKFTNCTTAVIPRVRAILSWNVALTNNPDQIPHYGNAIEADIQLARKQLLIANILGELKSQEIFKVINTDFPIPFKDSLSPDLELLANKYKKAGVLGHRLLFSTIGSLIHSKMDFSKAVALFNIQEAKNLKFDFSALLPYFNIDQYNADISYEEVTCVGLNTEADTLGAVIHIKKASGYSGDLCHKGSIEHIAFWADWNNDGIFDEYLGTQSFEVHDISNIPAGGLFYNVALPINVSGKLKECSSPNIIKVRAVLSWESLPSTTIPNALNTWGNSKDSLVQLRPGKSSGIYTVITEVGDAARVLIHASEHLYNYNAVAPDYNNNRPWGGVVNFKGIIDRNGFEGTIKYRIQFKSFGAADTEYTPVASVEVNGLWNSLLPWPACLITRTQSTDINGWFVYQPYAVDHIFSNDDNHLANWNASGLPDGTYSIRFEYTDESGNPVTGDEFSIVICNKGMTVSTTPNTVVDPNHDLDLVIDGGDCHSYSPADPIINGHVKAIHPYFAKWTIELQPTSHTHGVVPSPTQRDYSSLTDMGDANAPWTLNTAKLDPCGYTVVLLARTRVILNNDLNLPLYGPKAVGFAKLPL